MKGERVWVITTHDCKILGVTSDSMEAENIARRRFEAMGFSAGKVAQHHNFGILSSANIAGIFIRWEAWQVE